MKTTNTTLIATSALALVVLATGCSTVMCGKTQTIPVVTKPPGAEVVVYDRYDDIIFEGVTPCQLTLARSHEDLRAGNYRLTINKAGFEPFEVSLTGKVNRAYTVNIMNGGIGYAVDPVVGAMHTLVPMEVNESLVAR